MKSPLLSILICTMPERKCSYDLLWSELMRQIGNLDRPDLIQLQSNDTPRGQMSIGAKRNRLKRSATGAYVVYIDDDDMISPNYIQLMLEACQTGKDIITFDFDYYIDGKYSKTMMMNYNWGASREHGPNDHCSKYWAINYNPQHRYTINECHYHLCAVRKELADQVSFPNANNAEDVAYSAALKPLIKSEFHIEHTLLNVYFSTTKEQNV